MSKIPVCSGQERCGGRSQSQ
nr:unnamed protein product [Callosobruchus chinensis]